MAIPAATRMDQETTHRPTLFVAFALGANTWKLGFTSGAAQRPRERRTGGAAHPCGQTGGGIGWRRRGRHGGAAVGAPQSPQLTGHGDYDLVGMFPSGH
jgi:hypothetical protein